MYTSTLYACPIFRGLSRDTIDRCLEDCGVTVKKYGKEQVLFLASQITCVAGILLQGAIRLSRVYYLGRETRIATVKPGNIFLLPEAMMRNRVYFTHIAAQVSEVLFFDPMKLYSPPVASANYAAPVIRNISLQLAQLSVNMGRKVSIISRRSLEDKVMGVFALYSTPGQAEIDLPFNRREMAEYMAVDRSALSYVLMKMKRQGLIDYSKNHFTLLYLINPSR